jgi:hypothetical protein
VFSLRYFTRRYFTSRYFAGGISAAGRIDFSAFGVGAIVESGVSALDTSATGAEAIADLGAVALEALAQGNEAIAEAALSLIEFFATGEGHGGEIVKRRGGGGDVEGSRYGPEIWKRRRVFRPVGPYLQYVGQDYAPISNLVVFDYGTAFFSITARGRGFVWAEFESALIRAQDEQDIEALITLGDL